MLRGDVIVPFNYRKITDGVCPTLTTRPEGLKTMILIVEEVESIGTADVSEEDI